MLILLCLKYPVFLTKTFIELKSYLPFITQSNIKKQSAEIIHNTYPFAKQSTLDMQNVPAKIFMTLRSMAGLLCCPINNGDLCVDY